MLSVMMAKLTGANLIHDVGYMESGLTGSYEMIVLTDELVAMTNHLMKGIDVNDETLLVEELDRVGPGGNFLDTDRRAPTTASFGSPAARPQDPAQLAGGRGHDAGSAVERQDQKDHQGAQAQAARAGEEAEGAGDTGRGLELKYPARVSCIDQFRSPGSHAVALTRWRSRLPDFARADTAHQVCGCDFAWRWHRSRASIRPLGSIAFAPSGRVKFREMQEYPLACCPKSGGQ